MTTYQCLTCERCFASQAEADPKRCPFCEHTDLEARDLTGAAAHHHR